MTGGQSLELRGLVGIAASLASAASWGFAPRLGIDRSRFRRMAVAAFALTRAGLYFAAFFLFHMQPRGDIDLYMQEAIPAYRHQLVYRDFITPHAPLSPYLFSAMLHIAMSPLTIIFFAVLFDIGAFTLWMRYSARLPAALTERRAALLMICSPVSLLTVAIDGQMNSLIALSLAWSAVAVVESRDALSGFAAAIPGVLVKFLSWVFVPGISAASRRKVAWIAGFVGLTVPIYCAFAAGGANILVPLSAEGTHKTTSNITFLWEIVTGISLGDRLPDLMLATAWLVIVVLTLRAANRRTADRDATARIVLASLISIMMVIQVFSKNTWDRYLVMAMFPLCWLAAEFTAAQIAAYCVWLVVNVTYRSYWAIVAPVPALVAHAAVAQHDPRAYTLLLGEILQTGGNIFILVLAVRSLLRLSNASQPPDAHAA
ncbi:MAG TPA: hypothetical protein VG714_09115 [Acidobacteriaceae bacterium]|nr:hypothetical protein [Acidobacteriaceae bacterium]